MGILILKPRKALNKAFLKVKPNRTEIESFKTNLIQLLDRINDKESEEFHKNLLIDFLKKTYYDPNHFVNTKGRNDLVIHNTNSASSTVGVIIETKKPTNKAEMLKTFATGDTQGQMISKINVKAFQELVLYYLRERITHKNIEIKYLIATNIKEWFIFDATQFDRLFAQNKDLVKQFNDFEGGRLADTKTDFFYKQVAEPFIAEIKHDIEFTYFDIREYEKPLRTDDRKDDNKLISLFKLLSPEHLLKLPFANDSNSLDKRFYGELLHIIGLSETKEGSKKLIERKKEGERNIGSFLENVIIQLDSLDKISRIESPNQFGTNLQERLFNVGLELCITWINRILFLKLLEAQLITYHNGDKSYEFLSLEKIKDYDDLNSLFFQVLARKHYERNDDVKTLFAKVPYLNSSLFEPTDIEQVTIFISNLKDDKTIPIISSTVLKNEQGKRRTGNLSALEYLFEFLNAYDFSSEGSEEIQEDNKTLINASVLGLIFEKINGYKDGSFFTPGFITMYMCRETIRKAVIQKFNEHCLNHDLSDLKINMIEDIYELIPNKISRKQANEIINSLKICDPAAGSGHFLVSALNELIAIKSELELLLDTEGRPLRDIQVEVINDELNISDLETGEPFFYLAPLPRTEKTINYIFGGDSFPFKPGKLPYRQIIQQSIFNEKRYLIENCLFGVDINPNSVKICRLRLWIELLKNAYYTTESNYAELETLPNIDINIKCGNSLISRFALDADLKQIARSSKWNVFSYQNAVEAYKKSTQKEAKREIEKLIKSIKTNYVQTIQQKNPKLQQYYKLKREYDYKFPENGLFAHEPGAEYGGNTEKRENEKQKLTCEIEKILNEIEAEKSFYDTHNAFEWRFEFPEVLNDDGDFIGFDVVIGNPPYGVSFNEIEKKYFKDFYSSIHVRTPESFNYFWGLTSLISKQKGLCNFIVPSSFLSQIEFEKTRKLILESFELYIIINLGDEVFDDVATPTCIVGYSKHKSNKQSIYFDLSSIGRSLLSTTLDSVNNLVDTSSFLTTNSFPFVYKNYKSILDKCYKHRTLKEIAEDVATGVSSGLDKAYVYKNSEIEEILLEKYLLKKLVIGGEINRYTLNPISGKYLVYITNENNISEFPNTEKQLFQFKNQLIKRREAANGTIEWYSLNWPRRRKLFDNPKILIRQTANRIIAAYDNEGWYCLKSGLIVQLPKNSNLHYFYLLALLNSKLFYFLYHDLVNEDNRIFPEVKPIQLFKLPIKEADKNEQEPIINLVEQINSAKSNGLLTDNLESQIDQLVYHLYNLTEEEIKIIENEVK